MASSSSSVQEEGGRPGESSAILIGFKRTRSTASDLSDTNETDPTLIPCGPKKPRKISDIEGTLELSELYSYVGDISTKDEPKPVIDDSPSKEDVKFMKMAQKVSMNSPDNSTKVGAIIVDPKEKKVLGEGWNRMPQGCEDRFAWAKGVNDILKTKYPYVLHGVKAAILDALKQHGDSLKGSTLYSTLIPDHKDSQMIREVGITKVVYKDDKFPQYAFTIASKRILDGLDWRKIEMPDEGAVSTESDAD